MKSNVEVLHYCVCIHSVLKVKLLKSSKCRFKNIDINPDSKFSSTLIHRIVFIGNVAPIEKIKQEMLDFEFAFLQLYTYVRILINPQFSFIAFKI